MIPVVAGIAENLRRILRRPRLVAQAETRETAYAAGSWQHISISAWQWNPRHMALAWLFLVRLASMAIWPSPSPLSGLH